MSKMKKYWLYFAAYTFAVFTPFMFDSLNQIEPRVHGMPFTFWSVNAMIIAGCILVYWGSVHAWDSYDDYHKDSKKSTKEDSK